ncbi:hypothetical protein B0H10DRAFT_1958465 [Mycena sp. CBHHK59/15]|nr:hypothetical protein B0H10DRAFT_1958465 [Mycena sp. CBHHK59/15]
MKSLSVIALFSALGSLCLAQETFPGARFTISTNITGLNASADLTKPFVTISGTILERKTMSGTPFLTTRQEGLWSEPPAITTQLTPSGDYLLNGTTVVKFSNFNISDSALIDICLGVKGAPGTIPNILFTVSYSSPCSSFLTVSGNINLWIYTYEGLKTGGNKEDTYCNCLDKF